MTDLWGGRRVPMTLLGGYLGAGKTTLVNHLLAHADRRIAVLVNDVGAVRVDADLIAAHHDDTIELTNGCVCCSLVDGFAMALEALRARPEPPDHVLIELSGVAEPGRVVPWASTAGFALDGVAVVADADSLPERADDPRLRELVRRQVRSADLVLVSKLDLADPDRVASVLDEFAPETLRIGIMRGAIDPAVVLGPIGAGSHRPPSPPMVPVAHEVRVVSPEPAPSSTWEARLDRLPPTVVRVKGVVPTGDGPRLVQVVGRRWSLRPVDGTPVGIVVVALERADADRAVGLLSGRDDG